MADTGCVHVEFGGMERVESTDRSVRFACSRCGATFEGPRCVAVTRGGARCNRLARRLRVTCPGHASSELATAGARGGSQVPSAAPSHPDRT